MPVRNKIINLLFLFSVFISAQPFERALNRIAVNDASGILLNIFSGGHSNIEHQFVDIDGDGDLDLMYLDSDNTYGWYKNVGDQFSPEYILSFDTIPGLKFNNWFYLVDIDDDNDYDIFTGGTSTLIEFRRNTGSATNPFFTLESDTIKCLFIDSTGNKVDSSIIPIFTDFGCNNIFIDIDNDNDKDLFLGNSVGTVYFYKNIGNNQNFSFEFITDKWQDILIFEGGFRVERHGASSLDFADIDNDNDFDLFWGDFFGRSLYFIENKGSALIPEMDAPYTYNTYPKNEDSIWTSGFNMSRLNDIDADGDLDLFVSVLYDITVPQSLMFYRNNGNAFNPDFNLENKIFLKTLDVGIHSSPVFVDIDNDGDQDMFIGSAKSPNGSLHFFENTGNAKNPSFILVDSVYFGIEGDLTITPSFGDLDGDGDYDLLIGEFLGRFSLYENTGTQFSPNFHFAGQLKDSSDNLISVGNIARPFLIDYDNDGDLDLITGAFNGQIRSYKNIGTVNNYIFGRDTTFFNFFDVGDISAPFLIDYDEDGDFDLFTGGSDGIIFYRNDGNNANAIWTLITDKFLNQTFGGYVYPFFTDIDDDTDQDIFIGNIKGGIYYFESMAVTNVNEDVHQPTNFTLSTFPNPFNSNTRILVTVNQSEEGTITIFNILGQKVKQVFNGVLHSGENHFTWDGKGDNNSLLASGNYFILYNSKPNYKVFKVVILK